MWSDERKFAILHTCKTKTQNSSSIFSCVQKYYLKLII